MRSISVHCCVARVLTCTQCARALPLCATGGMLYSHAYMSLTLQEVMAEKTAFVPPASEFANRWEGVVRPYSKEDVERLRGSIQIAYTLADRGANRLWQLMNEEPFVPALGALTGGQAVQQIKAGLKAVYCSGWQVDCLE